MEFQLHQQADRWVASGDMTIYHAASLKRLLALGDGESQISLDLAHVAEIDTCGLQALLMLSRRARAEQRILTLIAPSAAVREVFALCGLASMYDTAARQAA